MMRYLIYLSIPTAIALGFALVRAEELHIQLRAYVQIGALILCFLPAELGNFWRKSHPQRATGAYLSANALRILGIFVVLLSFQLYQPSKTLLAMELYALSIGVFLVFQLVCLLLLRKYGSEPC